MGLLGEMTVKLGVNTSSFTSGMGVAGNALNGFARSASSINPVVGTLVAVGAAAVGFGAQSIKMAGDFQSGMTTLVTGAGEAQSNIKMVSDGILKLAVDTGTTTKQLTDGMYMIESAGYHGAAGLDVLKAAAEGAKVGNASLATVANGVTTVMTDYAASGITASQATNTLIATVASGKTNMQALSTAMSSILPTASALHVSLYDTAGAMATMTGEGVNAAQSATYLRQLLTALENPAKKGATALKEIGLSSEDVANEMKKSLPDTLKMITDHLKSKFPEGSQAYIKALSDISGGSKQMQGMLDLTGEHLKTFQGNVTNISDTVKKGGNSIQGWSLVQQDYNTKMAQAKEQVETLQIKIGNALIPALSKIMSNITPLITRFTDWEEKNHIIEKAIDGVSKAIQNTVGFVTNLVTGIQNLTNYFQKNHDAAALLAIPLGILGGIMTYLAVTAIIDLIAALPALISGFILGAAAAWTMAVGVIAATWPFLLIGAAIGIVVALVILAINHWGEITKWLQSVWGAFSKWFMGLWNGLVAWITGLLAGIGAFFQQAWAFIIQIITTAGQMILLAIIGPFLLIGQAFIWLYNHNTYIKALVDAVVGFFLGLRDRAVAIISFVVQWLNAQWAALQVRAQILWRQISDAITGPINAARAYVIEAISYAHQYLSEKWAEMQVLATTAWNRVSQVFSQAWNTYIAKPLSDLWGRVSGWWNNTVIGGMKSFGGNMMQAIADGVTGAGGAVGDAIHSAISNALSSMGFHGIPGFATGVRNFGGGYALVGEDGPELVKLGRGSDVYTTAESRSMLNSSARSSGSSGGSGDGGTQYITVQLDSDVLMQALGSKAAKQIRLTHGRRVA